MLLRCLKSSDSHQTQNVAMKRTVVTKRTIAMKRTISMKTVVEMMSLRLTVCQVRITTKEDRSPSKRYRPSVTQIFSGDREYK